MQPDYSNKLEKAAALAAIVGHPLQTMTKENEALSKLIKAAKKELTESEITEDILLQLRDISVYYGKKGDLLYPHLKAKYEIAGPSDLMWTDDDEIRAGLSALTKETVRDDLWKERLLTVLTKAEQMTVKDQKVLFPICAVNFTEDEWKGIYRDSKAYGSCFGVKAEIWTEAENAAETATYSGEINMPGGHLTVEQAAALFNTIPMEITFIDANNISRFFNEGEKVFKRPKMALDREVFYCHPPKIEAMVRSIINDFRSGKRDRIPIWQEKNGRSILVTYMAVRDADKNYLGTVELVQDMEFAKEYFTKKG